jgi:dihydroceramide fatty acyl 2-hydroxylase
MKVMTSWATTFARFSPGRMPILGPIAVRVADWSRPQRGQAPLFDAPWLERFSVAQPIWLFLVYAPAGAFLLWRGWSRGVSLGLTLAAYAAGLLIWSLLEYVTHRGSFHHVPTSRFQVAFVYLMHGVHHAYPDDSRRWVMPLGVTLPITIALYFVFASVLGRLAAPVFGGFLHGYLCYDLLHYFIHLGRMPTRLGRYLRQYHLAHHYAIPDRHFGVSSPLWDVIFRTR